MGTTIWIDGDACPAGIKEIVFRASERLQIPVCLVANAQISTPSSPLVSAVCLAQGADAADKHILEAVSADDIVITADIPLAAEIVEKGAVAIDPRGELYTEDNVRERLSVANLSSSRKDKNPLDTRGCLQHKRYKNEVAFEDSGKGSMVFKEAKSTKSGQSHC